MVEIEGRICRGCGIFKPWEEYYRNSHGKNGRHSHCKVCASHIARVGHQRRGRFHYIELKYGITKETFMQMYESQRGLCAICKTEMLLFDRNSKRQAAIDHDHTTGKVRALLCNNCNRGIGMFKENQDNLLSAVDYLKEWCEFSKGLPKAWLK